MNCCSNCGSFVPDDAVFCSKCGSKISQQVSQPSESYQQAYANHVDSQQVQVNQDSSSQVQVNQDSNSQVYANQACNSQAQINQANQNYNAQYQTNASWQPTDAVYFDVKPVMSDKDRTLRLIAFIFNLISTIAVCWALIPLAWMIPMTVVSWGIYKGTRKNTVAFGVCTLIFLSLVGGILLLCSQKDD